MKSYKTFAIQFIVVIFTALGILAGFNYFIDPLWTFGHAHSYNDVQTVIDERQQKMNQMHYEPFEYETLLIGSSRTTYISQHDFHDMDVYNFSASDLSFKEYEDIIDYAKQEKGSDLERVMIGVDFFKSSKAQSKEVPSLESYTSNLEDPFYRFRNLISLDVNEYARKNFRLSMEDEIKQLRNYNRENVAFARSFDEQAKEKQTAEKIEKFRNEFYGESYEYNPEFKDVLEKIKRENPDTEFVLFTTPISAPLFEALEEEGNLDDYHRWLNDMIEVFGGVHHFMYPNSVTQDLSNYFDGHHFYPEVGTMIAEKISNDPDAEVPDDFGKYITEKIPAE